MRWSGQERRARKEYSEFAPAERMDAKGYLPRLGGCGVGVGVGMMLNGAVDGDSFGLSAKAIGDK